MGSVFAVNNIMNRINYEHIRCYKGNGNKGFCGWGVRDRGEDLPVDRSVLCQNWAASPGSAINYIRFRTGTVTGAGEVTFAFWAKAPSAVQYSMVGRVILDGSEFDGGWVDDTDYIYALPSSIRFPNVSGTVCLMSAYTSAGSNVALSYTSDTGSADARVYNGDASDHNLFNWDSGAGVSDVAFAVSAEALDEPSSWVGVEAGASMEDQNEEWHDPAYCTSPGGGWDNLGNIYDGNPATASTGVGGNGSVIYIDLAAGQIATNPWIRGSSFPDYSETGVRGLMRISISGEVILNGAIALAYSDRDTETVPTAGFENIYWNDTVGAFSHDITVPVLARWLRIVQAGTSAGDSISGLEVFQMQLRVANGKFYVEAEEPRHYVWVENYPVSDGAYKFSIQNVCGAESRTSSPMTNRRYKD